MDARILVIGYGNPARGDDGLGPALAARVEREAWPGVEVEIDFQLAVEHAAMIAEFEKVVFVDATVEASKRSFTLGRVEPERTLDFSTHSLSPAQVVGLSAELFGAEPDAWLLSITGERFEMFDEELSPVARERLERAVEFLRRAVAGVRRDRESTASADTARTEAF